MKRISNYLAISLLLIVVNVILVVAFSIENPHLTGEYIFGSLFSLAFGLLMIWFFLSPKSPRNELPFRVQSPTELAFEANPHRSYTPEWRLYIYQTLLKFYEDSQPDNIGFCNVLWRLAALQFTDHYTFRKTLPELYSLATYTPESHKHWWTDNQDRIDSLHVAISMVEAQIKEVNRIDQEKAIRSATNFFML